MPAGRPPKDESTLSARLTVAREQAGIKTKAAAARLFGVESQAVSQWESGASRPDQSRFPKIAREYGVNLEWLAYGHGPMIYQLRNVDETTDDNTAIPVIDYVQAGLFTEVSDPYEPGHGAEYIMTDINVSETAFGLIIRGTSMHPEFEDGDKVIVDPSVEPMPGDYVVAKLDKEESATFKKYRPRNNGCFELVPLNEDWPTIIIDHDNPGHIVATMVEHRRYPRHRR